MARLKSCPDTKPSFSAACKTGRTLQNCHSSGSGCKPNPFSPPAFFSFHFFTQASQLAPAARSFPVKVRPATSLYAMEHFSGESLGNRRTNDSNSVAQVLLSCKEPATTEPSLQLMVTSPR